MMNEGYKGHFGLVSDEKGYFCPFPCSFAELDKWLANLVTWQSLSGSRDEILNDKYLRGQIARINNYMDQFFNDP